MGEANGPCPSTLCSKALQGKAQTKQPGRQNGNALGLNRSRSALVHVFEPEVFGQGQDLFSGHPDPISLGVIKLFKALDQAGQIHGAAPDQGHWMISRKARRQVAELLTRPGTGRSEGATHQNTGPIE